MLVINLRRLNLIYKVYERERKATESWGWWRSQYVRSQVSSIVAKRSFIGQNILIHANNRDFGSLSWATLGKVVTNSLYEVETSSNRKHFFMENQP